MVYKTSASWRRFIPRLAALGGLAASLSGCFTAPYAKGTVCELFPEAPRPTDASYLVGSSRVHFVEESGGPGRIVFIHGSPGDWQGWAPLMRDPRLRAQAAMLAPDRPGWGRSDYGHVVPGLEAQADLLRPLLGEGPRRTLLVGHSFGGAVALRMALDHPQAVSGLLLIAPTLSPELERPSWYERLAGMFPARLLLPERLSLSLKELANLPQDLGRLRRLLPDLQVPVVVIQGEDDGQVDPRTADFAARELPARFTTVIRVPGQGHWILWADRALIVREILSMLRTMTADSPASRVDLVHHPVSF